MSEAFSVQENGVVYDPAAPTNPYVFECLPLDDGMLKRDDLVTVCT